MISITTWDTPGDCAQSEAERKDRVFGRARNGGRGWQRGRETETGIERERKGMPQMVAGEKALK